MKQWDITTALASVGFLAFMAAPASADVNPSELLDMSLAELSNIEVTSVSKRSEKESEAPAAIYVITQDDIRQSGLTSIPELLRMVPGLNVAQSGSHQWAISSRGFSGQYADTLLVLIDGRTVYTPIFSGVYWDVQDTPLEDIERIEVIRGPGATLWGANAVNGVINIITKSAKDTQGGLISQSAGNLLNSQTTVRYGGKINEAAVRMYAKYDDYDEFNNMRDLGAGDAWNRAQSGFRSDWKSGDNESFTFQGDIYRVGESYLNNLLQLNGTTVSTNVREIEKGANILGRWNKRFSNNSDLTVQAYYDDARRDHLVVESIVQTFDLDMQHVWTPVVGHEVVWGSAYRLVKSKIEGYSNTAIGVPYILFTPQSRSDNLFSAFIQDKITLLPNEVFLTVGSKFEHNNYTGFEYQPSARLSWLINDNQTLWSSVSRAVRTPNVGNTTSRVIAASGGVPTVYLAQVSSNDVESEELTAYEIGYRIQPQKNMSFDVAGFYNDYDHLITGVLDMANPFFEFSPTLGGPLTLFPISPQNLGKAHTWGGEMTAKWNPNASTELVASYTLLQMNFSQADPFGYAFPGKSPQQQFNVRGTVQLPHNVKFTTSAYYVDELTAIDPNTAVDIDAYTRLDMRLAWQAMENLELSLVGQNLLDRSHQEFSGFLYQNSSQIPRSFYGNITWKF